MDDYLEKGACVQAAVVERQLSRLSMGINSRLSSCRW